MFLKVRELCQGVFLDRFPCTLSELLATFCEEASKDKFLNEFIEGAIDMGVSECLMRDLTKGARERHVDLSNSLGTDGSGTAKRFSESVEKGGRNFWTTGYRGNGNLDGDAGGVLSSTRSNNKFGWTSAERFCSAKVIGGISSLIQGLTGHHINDPLGRTGGRKKSFRFSGRTNLS